MNYWFYAKWFIFTLFFGKVIFQFKLQNEVQDLLEVNMKTQFGDFLRRYKKLQVKYHPDSENGNSEKYSLLNEYKQKYFDDMNSFHKNKQILYFQSQLFESKLEKFQNNVKQISVYILKQIFIIYLIFQIDGNKFLFFQLVLFIGSYFLDAFIIIDYLQFFIHNHMRLQPVELIYFNSSIFDKYPFMGRQNILDAIVIIKILYFYATVLFSKMLFKDTDQKYLKIFIENLRDLKDIQNKNLSDNEIKQKVFQMNQKIDEVLPKKNKCVKIINKIFSVLILILFLLQMGSSLF